MKVYAIGQRVEIRLLKTIGEIVETKIITNNGDVKYNVMYVVNDDVSFCEFYDWQLRLVDGHAWGENEVGLIKYT